MYHKRASLQAPLEQARREMGGFVIVCMNGLCLFIHFTPFSDVCMDSSLNGYPHTKSLINCMHV